MMQDYFLHGSQGLGTLKMLMDILISHTKQEARVIKTKKGTIWNLERIDPHHVEIKSIGGADYHKETERLKREFEIYADYFTQALGAVTPDHKRLLGNHKQMLDSLDKEAKGRFASALIEAGILGN